MSAGHLGYCFAADDVVVLRFGSAITSGHQQVAPLHRDAFGNADDEVTRHRAVEVVGVGVVVIVPSLKHTGHVGIAFNVGDLHAVELFVLLLTPRAHLVDVAQDSAAQDFFAYSAARKLRPAGEVSTVVADGGAGNGDSSFSCCILLKTNNVSI